MQCYVATMTVGDQNVSFQRLETIPHLEKQGQLCASVLSFFVAIFATPRKRPNVNFLSKLFSECLCEKTVRFCPVRTSRECAVDENDNWLNRFARFFFVQGNRLGWRHIALPEEVARQDSRDRAPVNDVSNEAPCNMLAITGKRIFLNVRREDLDSTFRKAGQVFLETTLSTTKRFPRYGCPNIPLYMSPEQARGKEVDRRTDIWAFGCVMYEVLTGSRVYEGQTVSDSIARILERDPDWDVLPSKLPPKVRDLLRRCLQKGLRRRLQAIGDARIEIEEALADPSGEIQPQLTPVTAPTWRRAGILALAAFLVGGTMAGIAVWNLRPPEEPRRVAHFNITPPPTVPLDIRNYYQDVAISPDGGHIVYVGRGRIGNQLYLSAVGQFDATPIRGTEGQFVTHPLFLPDGSEIAFIAGPPTELKKVSIHGGVPVTLSRLTQMGGGVGWGTDGSIILGTAAGLFHLAEAGAEPEALTTPDSEKGETGNRSSPHLLPKGKAVLFSIWRDQQLQIAVLDLETGEHKELGVSGINPYYSPTGHVVYGLDGVLWAVAFDLNSRAITGNPVAVQENLNTKPNTGVLNFSLSDEGSLLYVPSISSSERMLVWVDREGKEDPFNAESRPYEWPRISPDGQRVVLVVADPGNTDVWIHDLGHNTQTRLTRDPAQDVHPLWTPDGKRIVFASNREEPYGLFWKRADGTGPVDRLMTGNAGPSSWSADGQLLFYSTGAIGVLSMEGERTQRPLLDEEFREYDPEVSPNGRWMAYTSDESDQNEIYVRPFPNVDDGKWTISRGGGRPPAWSPDGRELFYRNGGKMMVVEITNEPSFSHGVAQELFEGNYHHGEGRQYDIHPNGQRFLMLKQVKQPEPQLIIVLNWFEELKRLVPTDN